MRGTFCGSDVSAVLGHLVHPTLLDDSVEKTVLSEFGSCAEESWMRGRGFLASGAMGLLALDWRL